MMGFREGSDISWAICIVYDEEIIKHGQFGAGQILIFQTCLAKYYFGRTHNRRMNVAKNRQPCGGTVIYQTVNVQNCIVDGGT